MNLYTNVLIVGSGISGLYLSLNLRKDLNIIIVSKENINYINSYLAQGGILTAISSNDIPLFIEDTLKAGQYKNNLKAVKILAKESMDNILKLSSFGVPFDSFKTHPKSFKLTKEGAHSINRIVHVKDITGKSVQETLIKNVKASKYITFLEKNTLIDLLIKNNSCIGGVFFKDSTQLIIHSKVTILATGGIGGLFANSTNQRSLTGDSINIALKHNIKVKDLEYIQIHPTALYEKHTYSRRFLISEAIRGERGKLLNSKVNRFVNELLPRYIVSKAIFNEMQKHNTPNVYLDISFMSRDFLKDRFPAIYENFLNKGIDITKEPIPVSPAQHYFMGGIEVDLNSKTSLDNLYAIGETSCTGVHCANRLASNSILEALILSKRAANSINNFIDKVSLMNIDTPKLNENLETLLFTNKLNTIAEIKRRTKNLNVEFSYSG